MTTPTPPAAVYLGVAVATLFDDGDWLVSAVECSSPGYRRVRADARPGLMALHITNAESFHLPADLQNSEGWWWVLYDRQTDGNLLAAIQMEKTSWVVIDAIDARDIGPGGLNWKDICL